jgi:hypothetical protein
MNLKDIKISFYKKINCEELSKKNIFLFFRRKMLKKKTSQKCLELTMFSKKKGIKFCEAKTLLNCQNCGLPLCEQCADRHWMKWGGYIKQIEDKKQEITYNCLRCHLFYREQERLLRKKRKKYRLEKLKPILIEIDQWLFMPKNKKRKK